MKISVIKFEVDEDSCIGCPCMIYGNHCWFCQLFGDNIFDSVDGKYLVRSPECKAKFPPADERSE